MNLEPSISASTFVVWFKVKEGLKEGHSEYRAVILGMRYLDMSRGLLALDRKQHRLVTDLLTGHCALRQHLHIMGLPESAMCMKYGYEESSYLTGGVAIK